MAARPFNFSPGPATLPEPVLRRAAEEMLDWHGLGVGVLEMSHRSTAFAEIYEHAESSLRTLMEIPPEFKLLFMQGGAIGQNSIVPLNLGRGMATEHLITGHWSLRTQQEALRYGEARVVASNAPAHRELPAESSWDLRGDAAYLHVCSNETIDGVELHRLPDLGALGSQAALAVDCSSHFASRPMDWSRIGLAYAGAQKNLGVAGLTVVAVRESLLGRASRICPAAFNYAIVAAHGSMYNTPPTWAIYMLGLVLDWIAAQGGIGAIERRNVEKAALLYDEIDAGPFYANQVEPACRSRMNVPFHLHDASLQDRFLAEAEARGLLYLKGHKSIGGLRASLYNAMPLEGVQALVTCMREFAARHG